MSLRNVPLGDEAAERKPQINRRATVRYHCAPATSGAVLLVDRQEMQRAWVLDLSEGGAGLLLGRPLAIGQLVVIRIKCPSSERIYELPGRVAHATREPGGDWVVGCQLLSRLTRDELDSLLQ
ncbi:MAG: PilZ domain-containing protein [Gemmataceae bacterium]|nr:PilZ domain-containing protein [Gemmataceae bacterium]